MLDIRKVCGAFGDFVSELGYLEVTGPDPLPQQVRAEHACGRRTR